VCNLMIVKKQLQETVNTTILLGGFLSFVHVVKILICLVCIVANFKLYGL